MFQVESILLQIIFNPTVIPTLYDYFRKFLRDIEDEEQSSSSGFHDVFIGSLPRTVCIELGGVDAVKDDIFVLLSKGGVSAFKNTD